MARGFADFSTHDSYKSEVERSFAFTSLPHDMFLTAKADRLVDVARAQLGDLSQRSVLDVGCGVGAMLARVAPAFARAAGVDVEEPSVTTARQAGLDAALYDGARLPYDDGAFDVAYAVNVMHHVPPARWPAFARELLRVSRSLAFVFEHNPWNPLTRLAVYRCAFDDDAVLLRKKKTRALLEGAGGAVVDEGYLLFVPVDAGWARTVDARLARVPIGAQYFVCARPR